MANIPIYGSLKNELSQNEDKIIVFGSQVYGNGLSYSTTDRLVTTDDLDSEGLNWSSDAVEGNQYDINRFFKSNIDYAFNQIDSAFEQIVNIRYNYVPYTGATKNVSLGSNYYIGARGFYLPTVTKDNGGDITVNEASSTREVNFLINYNPGSGYNCMSLDNLFKTIRFSLPGNTASLWGYLSGLYTKINNISNPLRFMGVVKTTSDLPTTNVSKGDVWHLNLDMEVNGTKYYLGDDLVCINPSTSPITWDLLGANITRIDPDEINEGNLENWLNAS